MAKKPKKKPIPVKKTASKEAVKRAVTPAKPLTKSKAISFSFSQANRVQALIVMGIAFLLYINTAANRYAVDDTLVIVRNDYTKGGFSKLSKHLTEDSFHGFYKKKNPVPGGRYRPLTMVTHGIEYGVVKSLGLGAKPREGENWGVETAGLNPTISHIVNVLLFCINCFLVYWVLLYIFRDFELKEFRLTVPFIAAILYAAHPIHTEVVANIKSRDEILGMIGAMASLIFFIRYAEEQKMKYLVMGLLFFALGLFSKETILTFLAVIPLTLFMFGPKLSLEKYAYVVIPMVAFTGLYIYARGQVTDYGTSVPDDDILMNNPFLNAEDHKWPTIFYCMGMYLKLLIYPHPLTNDYYPYAIPSNTLTFADPWVLLSILVVFSLVAYALWGLLKQHVAAYSILFYFITLSIASNVVFVIGIAMNERFIFVSSLGYCIILAMGIVWLANYLKEKSLNVTAKKVLNPTVALVLLGVITVGYGFKTVTRNTAWKNDYTLFTTDYKYSQESAKAANSYAGSVFDKYKNLPTSPERTAMLEKAYKAVQKALSVDPNFGTAEQMRRSIEYTLYREDTSRVIALINRYKGELASGSGNPESAYNLGIMLKDLKRFDESERYFKVALERYKNKPEKIQEWRPALINMYHEAGVYYGKVEAKRMTDSLQYYSQLGNQQKVNEFDVKAQVLFRKSIPWFEKAVSADPQNTVYMEDLGAAYGFSRNFAKAAEILERAIQLSPNNVQTHRNLQTTYYQLVQQSQDNPAQQQEYQQKLQYHQQEIARLQGN